jgi:hypothetical protein
MTTHPGPPRSHRRPLRRGLPFLAALLLPLLPSCGDAPRDAIPRETFIEAYIALRSIAVRSPNGEVDPISRARILEERGLTEEDLLHFVEVHGRDVTFMGAIWEEIDNEISRRAREGESGVS